MGSKHRNLIITPVHDDAGDGEHEYDGEAGDGRETDHVHDVGGPGGRGKADDGVVGAVSLVVAEVREVWRGRGRGRG